MPVKPEASIGEGSDVGKHASNSGGSSSSGHAGVGAGAGTGGALHKAASTKSLKSLIKTGLKKEAVGAPGHHKHHEVEEDPATTKPFEMNIGSAPASREGTFKKVFQKKIMGDVFGVSDRMHEEHGLAGLMYRSRVSSEMEAMRSEGNNNAGAAGAANKEKKATAVTDDVSVFEENSDEESETFEGLNSRQQLSLTIRNWASLPENDENIIEEGAVHALVGLASMDDNFIKKCCARALNDLASRESNRERLLALGAATGVIQIAMSVRVWKIAKLCAQTLCSLSMHQNGEAIMAKDGAILALVILLGLKGQRLLPIASQALYNLTTVQEHYKGVERTVKAFLAMPASPTDTSLWFLKSLVNCCRYSWIRMRIIEDGALAGLMAVVPTLADKNPALRSELVLLICTALRLMSESVGCRIELLAKNALDILRSITDYCDEESRVFCVKAVYNIIQHTLSNAQFEISAHIVVQLAMKSKDSVVLELASACFHAFAGEGLRGMTSLANMIMDAIPRCLGENPKPLTQFYSVTTAGNLFFMKSTDSAKLEVLVENVVNLGDTLTDADAMEALTVALAKLSQDEFSMAILERRGLFDLTLKLMLRLLSLIEYKYVCAKEACAIGICRITLKLGNSALTTERKEAIASGLMSLLHCDIVFVLDSAISAIRSLGDANICNHEFLQFSDTLFSRLAYVVKTYGGGKKVLCRNCCALISNFSYMPEAHDALSQPDIVEVLFLTTRSDDTFTKETVASTICNMTMSADASRRLIKSGVCGIIATLSGATSEGIQDLCAKCICNLSCSQDLHEEIISHGVLQTILLIALVRTVEDKTKMLCARAIMNMITDSNIDSLKEAGAIRVFASIATVLNHTTQNQCAQGFLIFTTTAERRDDICSRKPVMQALFLMVKATSPTCRILVGMTVCNLLSCAKSQRAAISAGALQVLKIISTMDYPQLREASARVIINLVQVKSLYPELLRMAPVVPMLNFILHKSGVPPTKVEFTVDGNSPISTSVDIFDCAVNAMSCVAQAEEFREHVYEADGVQALTVSVLSGKVKSVATATEVIRAVCLLSYEYDFTPQLIDSQAILAMLFLYRMGLVVPESAEMICIIIRNCSTIPACREPLITNGAILLMRGLFKPMVNRSIAITRSIIISMLEFSKDEDLHEAMVTNGIVELLYNAVHPVLKDRSKSDQLFPVLPDQLYASFTHNETYEALAEKVKEAAFPLSVLDIERLSAACKNLSKTASIHLDLVAGEFTTIVEKFIDGAISEISRADLSEALCNLSSSKNCRQLLVDANAVPLLLSICQGTSLVPTQASCTVALGYLSEITIVGSGAVASLLELSATNEESSSNPLSARKDGKAGDTTEGTAIDGETATEGNTEEFATDTATDTMTSTGVAEGGKKLKDKEPVKSLRQMIKDGLLSSKNKEILQRGGKLVGGVLVSESSLELPTQAKKKTAAGMLVGRLRNITSHDMNSADAIERERDGLKHNYSKYQYKIFDNSGAFGMEHGGVATKHDTSLPYPSIHPGNAANGNGEALSNRNTGLTKIAISMLPLPKDSQVMDLDAMAQALALAEKEAEEREAQAAIDADLLAAEALLASGRASPSQMGRLEEEDGRNSTIGGKGGARLRKGSSYPRNSRNTLSPAQSKMVKTVTGAGAAWGNNSPVPINEGSGGGAARGSIRSPLPLGGGAGQTLGSGTPGRMRRQTSLK